MNKRPTVACFLILAIYLAAVCPASLWANQANNAAPITETEVEFEGADFIGPVVQTEAELAETYSSKTYFGTGQGCIEALMDGTANYYRPTYFSLFREASSREEVRKLESDACVLMLTVKGYRWVAQKEGEEMVFRGSTIVRRYDCGNPIRDILYPKTEESVAPTPTPTPTATPKPCPPGTYPGEEPGVCIKDVPGETPPPIDKTCKPGANTRLIDHHDRKGFDPIAMMKSKLTADQLARILGMMVSTAETAKVTSLIVYTNGCDYVVYVYSTIQKGMGWWKWVLIGAAVAAFFAGYFIGKHRRVTPIKTQSGPAQIPDRPIIRW